MKYVKGDLFDFLDKEKRSVLIPHITNNIGAWGSGFVMALSNRWPIYNENRQPFTQSPEAVYHEHESSKTLGETWVCCTELSFQAGNPKMVCVANMCAQDGIMSMSTGDRKKVNSKPIRYDALATCMEEIGEWILHPTDSPLDMMILAPKFGSLRAGGDWNIIEGMIEEKWKDIDVTIVDYGRV